MRLYKRGKYYWADYRYKGRRHRISLRTANKALALKRYQQLQAEIYHETVLGSAPRLRLSEFLEQYLARTSGRLSRSTTDRLRVAVERLVEIVGDIYLHDILPEHVDRYREALLSEGKAPGTVNSYLGAIRAMMHRAKDWGYLRDVPFRRGQLAKMPPPRVRYLSPEEVRRLLEAANPRLRAIIQVALNTGMRAGEILRLRWSDVDLARRVLTINSTKTQHRHSVYINDTLLHVLQNLPRSDERVFPIKSFRTAFRGACRRAGLQDFHFHDLRHTFSSYLAMAGVPLRDIAEWLGHRTLRSVMRYAHLAPSHLAVSGRKMDTIWAQLRESGRTEGPVERAQSKE